jgi:hypothetical protein
MEIKATTVYDEMTMKDFFIFMRCRGKRHKSIRNYFNIFYPILMFFTLVLIAIFFSLDIREERLFLIVLFFVMVFIWSMIAYIIPSMGVKNNRNLMSITNTYTFYDEYFELKSSKEGLQSSAIIQYNVLHKVYETSHYFYIFITNAQAYILRKDDIENGAVDQIRTALFSHLPRKKYIICL